MCVLSRFTQQRYWKPHCWNSVAQQWSGRTSVQEWTMQCGMKNTSVMSVYCTGYNFHILLKQPRENYCLSNSKSQSVQVIQKQKPYKILKNVTVGQTARQNHRFFASKIWYTGVMKTVCFWQRLFRRRCRNTHFKCSSCRVNLTQIIDFSLCRRPCTGKSKKFM